MHDLRYAIRLLSRSPGFAAIAILSLALGIGANTAMFSVSWVLFSQPLAIGDPRHLLAITNQLTIPRGMRGMYQINGTSYRDPASGRSYRANLSFPAYLAIRAAAGDAAHGPASVLMQTIRIGPRHTEMHAGAGVFRVR